ncbi:MAG: hypothetical protein ACQESG_04090 [Nanobdellota archaeon]
MNERLRRINGSGTIGLTLFSALLTPPEKLGSTINGITATIIILIPMQMSVEALAFVLILYPYPFSLVPSQER